MTSYVTRVKAKGAFPVLITPVARATFSGNTVPRSTSTTPAPTCPRSSSRSATEQNVPVLDMTARTVQWLTQLGPNGWQPYHALGTDATLHQPGRRAAVEAGFVSRPDQRPEPDRADQPDALTLLSPLPAKAGRGLGRARERGTNQGRPVS